MEKIIEIVCIALTVVVLLLVYGGSFVILQPRTLIDVLRTIMIASFISTVIAGFAMMFFNDNTSQ